MPEHERLMPDYPRVQHVPYKPNTQRNDLVADGKEVIDIFESPNVYFEDKLDGANCGFCLHEGHPIIRNRNDFLHKGRSKQRTPAKMQFSSIWNYFYDNEKKFQKLNSAAGFEVAVYGEWLWALNGISYDLLPSYFIAFDLYDWQRGYFMETGFARRLLEESGFTVPPLLRKGCIKKWEELDEFLEQKSPYSSTDKREGIFIKVTDGEKVVKRFKKIRDNFVQGGQWDSRMVHKNKLCQKR